MDFKRLKTYMDELTAWKIPGNIIVVYHDNEEVFNYSSGYCDLNKKIPMQGNELFNIYSCSKIATVVAALQLYQEGLFRMEDPLFKYIKNYEKVYVKDKDGKLTPTRNDIKMKDLFTMTAGFTYDCESKGIKLANELTDGKMDTVKVARALSIDPLLFEPGSHWNYSLSHDVLAAVVEIISGMRFSDYVQEHIFQPLGIQDAHYHRSPEIKKRMAKQYFLKEDGELVETDNEVSYTFGENYDSGGAGITVSVPEYAKLGNALANGGIGVNGRRILKDNMVELLCTNQLSRVCLQDLHEKNPEYIGYGYGFGVATMIDRRIGQSIGSVGEFGWSGAAGGLMVVDPKRRMSYFYASHMLNSQVWLYQGKLRNVVYTCLE